MLHDMLDWLATSRKLEQAKKAKAMIDAFQQSSVPVIESADYTTLSGDFLTLSSHPACDRLTTDSKALTVIHLDFTTPQAATCE